MATEMLGCPICYHADEQREGEREAEVEGMASGGGNCDGPAYVASLGECSDPVCTISGDVVLAAYRAEVDDALHSLLRDRANDDGWRE